VAKGKAICIGLNHVDPQHYNGWSGELNACEADAKDMTLLASSQKFETTTILTTEATREVYYSEMGKAADALQAGDILLVTYSGHGGQVPDQNEDEPDGLDETWCLFDGQLIDDENFLLLSKFKEGVRVIFLSDSCHSGSAIKELELRRALALRGYTSHSIGSSIGHSAGMEPVVYRGMPMDVVSSVYLANKAFYDDLGSKLPKTKAKVNASCLLISGCQDSQLSADGAFNGRFTGVLKTVWNGGKFSGTYKGFHNSIAQRMPLDQTPQLFPLGVDTEKLSLEKPFTI